MSIKHPSFENRWITVFKWEDRATDLKIRNDIACLRISSESQGARTRMNLGTNTPSNIRKPLNELGPEAMRTEVQILKF